MRWVVLHGIIKGNLEICLLMFCEEVKRLKFDFEEEEEVVVVKRFISSFNGYNCVVCMLGGLWKGEDCLCKYYYALFFFFTNLVVR